MNDQNPKSITKAVIPAAGLGTRFLPATKATPKEMLPVVDRPAIQYVVEEAVRAGLEDVLMITGRNKRALEDHFDRVPTLENQLEEQGKEALLQTVVDSNQLGEIHFVRQGDPKGLGHAVLRGKVHVGQEPFAVLLGDDLIDEKEDLLSEMVATRYDHTAFFEADLRLIPALAFDRQGWRLGQGGGYYDRLLAAVDLSKEKSLPLTARKNFGLVFAAEILDEVPHDSWDAFFR